MNYIPQDIIFHIFLFLSTPVDQSYITPISKYFYHTYLSSAFYKEKKYLINIAYMIQEDNNSILDDHLALQWESFFKFHWSKPICSWWQSCISTGTNPNIITSHRYAVTDL